MAESFKAQVDRFIKESRTKSIAVFKAASQDVIQDAQVSVFKGGNMPIITSFLINSGAASIDSLPIGESKKPDGYAVQDWNPSETVTTINRVKAGDILYFGWTAEYARYMENKYKFMRTAAQDWPAHVNRRAAEVKNL